MNGFCLLWDEDGVPYLDECTVERVSDQIFLLPVVGEHGKIEGYDSLAFGIDFFYHHLNAQLALVKSLGDAASTLRRVLNRLLDKLEAEGAKLEQERGNDAGEN